MNLTTMKETLFFMKMKEKVMMSRFFLKLVCINIIALNKLNFSVDKVVGKSPNTTNHKKKEPSRINTASIANNVVNTQPSWVTLTHQHDHVRILAPVSTMG